MSENIAQTVQKVIQDLVAPDVRELKTLVLALQKQIDQRFDAVDQRFEAVDQRFEASEKRMDQRFEASEKRMDQRFEASEKRMDQRFEAQSQKTDAQFAALMAAFSEFKAQSELATIRVISQLSERVAVLEAHR